MSDLPDSSGKNAVPPLGARTKPLVLLVDDDASVLRALRSILTRKYHVAICADPKQAVSEAMNLHPDVIVLDIKMPEHDGFWVFREVRKGGSDALIIFNSAYQDTYLPSELQATYDAFGYLPKNGSAQDFLALISKAASTRGWPKAG